MKRGWLKAHGKQRTDSTHVLGAIRALSRLETVGETMRATLNVLATVAPDWLRPQTLPDWFDRYEKRCEAYRLPKGKVERKHYAEVIGADGRHLLSAIYDPRAPQWLREIPMVQILRQVWVQQYYATEEAMMQWREDGDLPPGALLIHSPYNAEARLSVKRDIVWAGYKVHLTETCDDETPHLITHVETTVATTYDGAVTETIQTALGAKGLLPDEHIVDSGYIDAELIVTSQKRHGLTLLGPVPADTSWQAQAATGFAALQFQVDWEHQKVTCPVGKTNRCWTCMHDRHGKDVVHIKFDPADCRICPCRPLGVPTFFSGVFPAKQERKEIPLEVLGVKTGRCKVSPGPEKEEKGGCDATWRVHASDSMLLDPAHVLGSAYPNLGVPFSGLDTLTPTSSRNTAVSPRFGMVSITGKLVLFNTLMKRVCTFSSYYRAYGRGKEPPIYQI